MPVQIAKLVQKLLRDVLICEQLAVPSASQPLREGERTTKPCTDDSSLFHLLLPEEASAAALLFMLSAYLLVSHYIACNMTHYQ